jgi:hypothetical protein
MLCWLALHKAVRIEAPSTETLNNPLYIDIGRRVLAPPEGRELVHSYYGTERSLVIIFAKAG